MRILLVIPHFFRAEAQSRHSSTDARRREQRAVAIRSLIGSYRGQFGPARSLHVAGRRYEPVRAAADTLDILVLTSGEDHLLPPADAERLGVRVMDARPADPRRLGFAAHAAMADLRHGYDLFCYSEDDLRVQDPSFFDKLLGFTASFGESRVLLPNRYEWNPRAATLKTYIDGPLRHTLLAPFEAALPDAASLAQEALGRRITLRRAANPHSGFFALTAAQLAHWIEQPHFGDGDCSFVGPLESAATLGLLKTFPIYKPFGRDMGWLQIEHLDNRFSAISFPPEPPEG